METEIITNNSKTNKSANSSNKNKFHFKRKFSSPNIHPFNEIKWSKRTAEITNERGETIFKQTDVEAPEAWSQMAINVVVSKYFRGGVGTADRETSVKQLIARIADTVSNWGNEDNYFSSLEEAEIFNAELTSILLNQYASFNSPVWFNVGVEEKPQCSACFILSVEDKMDSLLDLQKTEAMLFKYGSGAGTNLSTIRSSKESVKGGGHASGPVSFMRGYDSWAGTIKSGGKTRRAAKMQILNIDHPDIKEFVNAKRLEEEKAWALIEQGYSGGFNVPGGAYESVFFQNSNLSVRVTDEFMKAVVGNKTFATRKTTDGTVVETLDAKELLREIAHGVWVCGDPGIQFDTTINEWHTCPESGRINSSNPCSEYMHVDNSACNLASINLLRYLKDDGTFDIDLFKHTVNILITAQDILIDRSSYPTEKIGQNARNFRQLGLGFANLGALLMSQGLPYDSDEGRAYAGSIMALLTGQAYLMSSKLAERKGAFKAFEMNRKPMLKVIEKHLGCTEKLPDFLSLDALNEEAKKVWEEALVSGKSFGYRNSQATVLAPTGTIAFIMDCDTTGIEPDIALIKYKKLVGGGMLKLINASVPRALRKLGYGDNEVLTITKYLEEHDTIEGAPDLNPEHLPIFDCAFKPSKGERSINYLGHLKMMSAAQPFVSGAISKTVNLPEACTVDEIVDTYVDAWKMGLKAVAIYRDNSKRSQPLQTSQEKEKAKEVAQTQARKKLPNERQAITHKFSIAGHEGYLTVGMFEDGTPGEIFVVMAKEGSTLSGVMDAFATSISMALQYGVPLKVLVKKFAHMRFEPSGFTGHQQIPFAKSIMDYIFRWLAYKFLPIEDQKEVGIQLAETTEDSTPTVKNEETKFATKTSSTANGSNGKLKIEVKKTLDLAFEIGNDAPPCTVCGSGLMVRQGACYRCLNCGTQGGCG